jgi:hypothetical protein
VRQEGMRDTDLSRFAQVGLLTAAQLLLNSKWVVIVILPALNIPVATINIIVFPPLQIGRDVLMEACQRFSAALVIFHIKRH